MRDIRDYITNINAPVTGLSRGTLRDDDQTRTGSRATSATINDLLYGFYAFIARYKRTPLSAVPETEINSDFVDAFEDALRGLVTILNDGDFVTLPSSIGVGTRLMIVNVGREAIIRQDDEQHSISYLNRWYTTKGTSGELRMRRNDRIELIYRGAGLSPIQPFVKQPNPASLPPATGLGVAWSPDGQYVAVIHFNSPYVRIYAWQDGSLVPVAFGPTAPPPDTPRGVGWSPDGRYLVITHLSSPFVSIYDLQSGSPVKIADPATLPTGTPYVPSWSPDGRYLALPHDTSPFVTIYDWQSGSPVKTPNPSTLPTGNGRRASWSPDGRILSLANFGSESITLYSFLNGGPVKIAPPDVVPVTTSSLKWSPDGRFLFAGHGDITIYDASSGIPVWLTDVPFPGNANNLSVSPNGRYVIGGNTTAPFMYIYDLQTGRAARIADPAVGPPASVNGTSWSPDSQYFAVAHNVSPFVSIYRTMEPVDASWLITEFLTDDPYPFGSRFR